jgi:hypothetical protein
VIATATNKPPTTPPTMAGMLVLWFLLLLIGLGVGGEDEGHPPESLWYYHKDTSTN